MQEGYYQFNRIYVSGDKEGDFYDVLPEVLTLNDVSWYGRAQHADKHETMFKEVKIKPYQQDKEFIKKIHSIPINAGNDWKKSIWNTLKQIIFEKWNPGRFHVVAHSGGIDSRILSTIIRELYREHGRDWLGDVLFVENGGEADAFKQIMKHQGWDKKQYLSHKEGKNPHFYHKEALDFDGIRNRYNGVSSYPFNLFYECYETLATDGIIPQDFQGFAAFGPYVDLMFRRMGVENFLHWDYYYQFRTFRRYGDWFFPWWDYRYIFEIASHMAVYGLGRTRVSEVLNPIPSIPNVPFHLIVDAGYRDVSKKIMDEVMYRFFISWYGQNIQATPNWEIKYSKWWGQYCEASICEDLIGKGYKINLR